MIFSCALDLCESIPQIFFSSCEGPVRFVCRCPDLEPGATRLCQHYIAPETDAFISLNIGRSDILRLHESGQHQSSGCIVGWAELTRLSWFCGLKKVAG